MLLTMDSDFTHNPEDLPRLIQEAENHDVVVGSRFKKLGSLPGWSAYRRFMTIGGHVLTRTTLGLPYDASGALRLYRLKVIPKDVFDLVQTNGYDFFLESLFVLHRNSFRIGELPIVLPARTYGTSKMQLRDALRSAFRCFALGFENLRRPERFMRVRADFTINPKLVDPQDWDEYWAAKSHPIGSAYDIVAAIYRQGVIKRHLHRHIRRHFKESASLLHAGCGSGQVDVDLQREMAITGLDISAEALKQYGRNNPRATPCHGDIYNIPVKDKSFDGVYNLGVMEHFTLEEIEKILNEFRRVIKDDGRLVLFWPHRFAPSVWFLKTVRAVLKLFVKSPPTFHPPEITYCTGASFCRKVLERSGLELESYTYEWKDLYIQAVVVARLPRKPAKTTVEPTNAAACTR